MTTTELRCGRRVLALHRLREGRAGVVPVLRLHALGGRAGEPGPLGLEHWPGEVWGLDFSGHGASSRPVGGGYCPEVLMAEADAAVAHLGPVVVVGWGVGAYAGLLLGGARPESVTGLVLADGAGLAGSDAEAWEVTIVEHPPPPVPASPGSGIDPTTDPYAWAELQADHRPAEHAVSYLRRAVARRDPAAGPFAVVALDPATHVAWVDAVEAEPGVLGRHALGAGPRATGAQRVAAALRQFAGGPG